MKYQIAPLLLAIFSISSCQQPDSGNKGVSSTADIDALRTTVTALEDRAAISDLVFTFADAATQNDTATIRTLFTSDAKWVIGKPLPLDTAGIEGIMEAFVKRRSVFVTYFVEEINGGKITVNGNTATGRWLVHEYGVPPTGGYENVAYYLDDYVKTPSGWQFKRRDFEYIYYSNISLQGTFYNETLPVN